jgi:lipopolysaccharide biosynthesis glycosyltransferase
MFQYFKFNIFNTYFKQWDSVLYIDVGMHIINPIQRFFDLDIKGRLLANSDSQPSFEWTLANQFDLNSEYSKNLIEHYDLNKNDYFQSGVLLFDTHIIEENTVSKLIELMNTYPIANGDQAIMNLYFLNMRNLWTPLPLRDTEGLLYDYDERNNKKEDYIMIKYPKS